MPLESPSAYDMYLFNLPIANHIKIIWTSGMVAEWSKVLLAVPWLHILIKVCIEINYSIEMNMVGFVLVDSGVNLTSDGDLTHFYEQDEVSLSYLLVCLYFILYWSTFGKGEIISFATVNSLCQIIFKRLAQIDNFYDSG